MLPNQTPEPGNVAGLGITGAPDPAVAGQNYSISVRISDNWYNAVGNAGAATTIHLTTNDPYDPSDSDQQINAGSSNFLTVFSTHKFRKASTTGWTVMATTSSGAAFTTATAGPVPVTADIVSAGQRLLVLLPGETYDPGNTSNGGKSTAPNFTGVLGHTPPLAGETFPVTVLGTDQFYNVIADTTNPSVAIGAHSTLFPQFSPSSQFTLSAGSNTLNVTINKASPTASAFDRHV